MPRPKTNNAMIPCAGTSLKVQTLEWVLKKAKQENRTYAAMLRLIIEDAERKDKK